MPRNSVVLLRQIPPILSPSKPPKTQNQAKIQNQAKTRNRTRRLSRKLNRRPRLNLRLWPAPPPKQPLRPSRPLAQLRTVQTRRVQTRKTQIRRVQPLSLRQLPRLPLVWVTSSPCRSPVFSRKLRQQSPRTVTRTLTPPVKNRRQMLSLKPESENGVRFLMPISLGIAALG